MKRSAYIISKMFFYIFSTFFVFVLIFSMLSFAEYYFEWDIPFVEITNADGQDFANISIPFIDLHVGFIFNFYVLIILWFWLLFYVFYTYALKEFFKVFITEKIFASKSLEKLQFFFKLNFIPIVIGLVIAIVSFIRNKSFNFDEEHFAIIVHAFVAFLVYLYIDILKKGKHIQEENDLTI